MPKRLLIAGYGFLGKALKPAFATEGWQVSSLSRSGQDDSIVCDLSSSPSVESIVGEYDLIIHCAASGGGGVDSYRDVYLAGSRNLMSRFPDTRLIFTSSTSVYPQTDHALVTEESIAEPDAPRAAILRESENMVIQSGGIVVRLTGLYGEGRCHVLKNFLAGSATLDGGGERIMNFVHRRDVAQALLLLADRSDVSGEIFNVNGGYSSQREVYQSLADHFDRPLPLCADKSLPRKRGNTSKKVSSAKLESMGWRPQYRDFLSLALACAS